MGKGCRTIHRLLCQPIQDNIRRCCAMTNWNEVSNSSAARRMIGVAPPTAIGTLPRQCGGSCARAVPDTTSRAKEGAGVQSVCAWRAGARANSGSGRPDPLAVRPTWDSFSLTSRSFVPTASAPGPRESGTEEKSPVTNGLTGARHESLYAIGNSLCVSLSAGFVASIEPTAEQIKNQTACMIVTDRGRSSGPRIPHRATKNRTDLRDRSWQCRRHSSFSSQDHGSNLMRKWERTWHAMEQSGIVDHGLKPRRTCRRRQ